MTEQFAIDRDYSSASTSPANPNVFDETYTKFYPDIVGLLRRRGAGDDAEDIAQEAFVRAFKHLDDYEDRGKIKAWLYTLAKNAMIDHYRRRRCKPLDFTDDEGMFDRVGPDYTSDPGITVAEEDVRDQTLANVVANVTADQANIFRLMVDGYNSVEISEILNVPQATVLTRIHRGRKALKAAGILPIK